MQDSTECVGRRAIVKATAQRYSVLSIRMAGKRGKNRDEGARTGPQMSCRSSPPAPICPNEFEKALTSKEKMGQRPLSLRTGQAPEGSLRKSRKPVSKWLTFSTSSWGAAVLTYVGAFAVLGLVITAQSSVVHALFYYTDCFVAHVGSCSCYSAGRERHKALLKLADKIKPKIEILPEAEYGQTTKSLAD